MSKKMASDLASANGMADTKTSASRPDKLAGLYIFTRDLRIHDNPTLCKLGKEVDVVYCVFFLDPKQADAKKNEYFSLPAFKFMIESIAELSNAIELCVIQGSLEGNLKKLIAKLQPTHLATQLDYTPFAKARSEIIADICTKYGVELLQGNDLCINSPTDVKAYKKFTPYYKAASCLQVRSVVKRYLDVKGVADIKRLPANITNGLPIADIDDLLADVKERVAYEYEEGALQKGGRTACLVELRRFKRVAKKYDKLRDMFNFESSRLSPHLKFGVISPVEVYRAVGDEGFRKQLYWRDFYMQVSYWFDVYGTNFNRRYDAFQWESDPKYFKAWCEGKTGYDLVDACMVQLNTTGFMHNRGRMIVANFLTKILMVDWRLGEKYFATKLTDYDPHNNNGGWQWSAGTGCDAQPYYRIFSVDAQRAKYDPDYEYIIKYLGKDPTNRPPKIVDFDERRELYFKKIKEIY